MIKVSLMSQQPDSLKEKDTRFFTIFVFLPLTMDTLTQQRKQLPKQPGVYRFYNEKRQILYIGKARNLYKRVNSYFSKQHNDIKTRQMVKQIAYIDYTVTNNEIEAYLLENQLIIQYQPKYNVLLKDGKTYPYLCIKNEPFPRILPVRKKIPDGSLYYGPYTSATTLYQILRFIRQNYFIRTCNLALTKENIAKKKFRPCLEYHIKKCKAPCVGLMSEEAYDAQIEEIKQLLEGNLDPLIEQLEEQKRKAVEDWNFEEANHLKNRIAQLRAYKERHAVVVAEVDHAEVLTLVQEGTWSAICYFQIRHGAIVATRTFFYSKEASLAELCSAAVATLIEDYGDRLQKQWFTNVAAHHLEELAAFTGFCFKQVALDDGLYRVIQLGIMNAKAVLEEKRNLARLHQRKTGDWEVLKRLQHVLALPQLPLHIECFDNSHLQGDEPVAACVVFREGKPAKRDYRVYCLEPTEQPDDYAYLRQVIYRRYLPCCEGERSLPELIVIDGGKGHLNAAAEVLRSLGLLQNTTLISIAKRLEVIYRLSSSEPLLLSKNDIALKLLQQLRNEAHKTALQFHRKRRLHQRLQSSLTRIPGIGPKTAQRLFAVFGSIEAIREATLTELIQAIGTAKAKRLWEYFHRERSSKA